MIHRYIICVALMLIATRMVAQQKPAKGDQLTFDPGVRYGKLPNGFTYYIRNTGDSTGDIILKLIVKAGREQQTPEQFEAAHLLEHMAFLTTRHFPKMRDHFIARGLQWGKDFNAHTGARSTIYDMSVPPGNAALLNEVLQLFRDRAQDGILMDRQVVETQKGVVLQELSESIPYSSRRSAYMAAVTQTKQIYPSLRSAEDIRRGLAALTYESLLQFYQDWYTPGRQAIIIVGNINSDEVTQKIKKLFGTLEKRETPKNTRSAGSPKRSGNLYYIDSSASSAGVEWLMFQKLSHRKKQTRDDCRYLVQCDLLTTMMTTRFKYIDDREGVDNISSSYSSQLTDVGDPVPGFTNSFMSSPSVFESVLKAMLTELQRAKLHGFSDQELGNAKTKFLKSKLSPGVNYQAAADYSTHFLEGAVAMAPGEKKQLYHSILEEISLTGINAFAKKILDISGMDIVVLASKKNGAGLPSKNKLLGWVDSFGRAGIQPLQFSRPTILDRPLLTGEQLAQLNPAAPGSFQQRDITGLDATELTLSNGLKIIVKTTKSGTISFKAQRKAPIACYPEKEKTMTKFASLAVSRSGIGSYNKTDLEQYRRQKEVRVSPFIGDHFVSVTGNAKNTELETMMQWVYLLFRYPGIDTTTWNELRNEEFAKVQVRDPSPNIPDTVDFYINQRQENIASAVSLQNISTAQLLDSYKKEFANPRDFFFVLEGNIDKMEAAPLIEKYLGVLKVGDGTGTTECKTVMERNGMQRKVYISQSDKAREEVHIKYIAVYEAGLRNELLVDLLGQVLKELLRVRLRDKEGMIYSPFANSGCSESEGNTCFFNMAFQCEIGKGEKGIAYMKEEIDSLRMYGIDAITLDRAKQVVTRAFERKTMRDGFWTNYFLRQQSLGQALEEISRWDALLASITTGDIQGAASRFFTGKNYYVFHILPLNK